MRLADVEAALSEGRAAGDEAGGGTCIAESRLYSGGELNEDDI